MELKDVLEALKAIIRPRIAFGLWVTCLLGVLLSPYSTELEQAKHSYGPLIYSAGLLFFVLWSVEIGFIIYGRKVAARKQKEQRDHITILFSRLNPNELFILGKLLCQGHDTAEFPTSEPGIATLVVKQLIVRIPVHNNLGRCSVFVSTETWNALNENKSDFLARARAANSDKADKLTVAGKSND